MIKKKLPLFVSITNKKHANMIKNIDKQDILYLKKIVGSVGLFRQINRLTLNVITYQYKNH